MVRTVPGPVSCQAWGELWELGRDLLLEQAEQVHPGLGVVRVVDAEDEHRADPPHASWKLRSLAVTVSTEPTTQ
jgi:hypothetical protein